MLNGGKTVNGTNFYPDKKKWEIIDPKGIYNEKYNRYAHINCKIINEKSKTLNTSAILSIILFNEVFICSVSNTNLSTRSRHFFIFKLLRT